MKYFVKIIDGVPSGDVTHEGSSLIAAGETWVEVAVPAYPQDGYKHTLSAATIADGVYRASWQAQPDDTHEARTYARAWQVRQRRDALINDVEWRYSRYERNARTGAPQQDNLASLDAYVQALADVTTQAGFPWDIQWPKYVP
jgi:hypothetical protein